MCVRLCVRCVPRPLSYRLFSSRSISKTGAGSAANESTAKSPLPKSGLLANEHATAELFHTPLSSINVTPMTPSDFVAGVVGLPKVLLNGNNNNTDASTTSTMHGSHMQQQQQQHPSNANGLDNISVATFGSPNSDIFTSSPHHARMWTADQRDQVLTVSVNTVIGDCEC